MEKLVVYGTDIKSRNKNPGVIFKDNGFSYKIIPFWAEWPKELYKVQIPAVCCGPDDKVFVLARSKEIPIAVFSNKGKFLYSLKPEFPGHLHGMSINSKGELLCTDDQAHVIFKINSNTGKILHIYGKLNKPSDTGYHDAYGLMRKEKGITDAEFYDFCKWLDMGLDSIKKTAPPFNKPTWMVEAPNGDLYCSDGYGNAAIHHFTADGNLIKTWGSPGRGIGQFRLPHSLWVDKKYQVWVADRENSRVQVFSKDGNILKVIGGLLRAADIWCDGNIMYIGELDGGITICDLNFNILAQLGYYQSPLRIHSITGNSKKDLFFAVNPPCVEMDFNSPVGLVKLKRL